MYEPTYHPTLWNKLFHCCYCRSMVLVLVSNWFSTKPSGPHYKIALCYFIVGSSSTYKDSMRFLRSLKPFFLLITIIFDSLWFALVWLMAYGLYNIKAFNGLPPWFCRVHLAFASGKCYWLDRLVPRCVPQNSTCFAGLSSSRST